MHIEVPTDVMPMPCPELPGPAPLPIRALPLAVDLTAAAKKLNAAKRVVLLVGGGCRGQEAALRALAEKLDAPVVQTVNARGMMHGHPLCIPASPSLEAVRKVLHSADQLLSIGTEFGPTEFDMYGTGGVPDLPGQIRIDIDADQLARRPCCLAAEGRCRGDDGGAAAPDQPAQGRRCCTGCHLYRRSPGRVA